MTQTLALYFHALSGRTCEIVPYDDDADVWQRPDTATTVRLPAGESAGFYRVAMAHRALHYLLGTFPARSAGLPIDVFAVLEDLRIDAALPRVFPGLARTFATVRTAALAQRPELATLPPRSALAEALVRLSLGERDVPVPAPLREPWARVVAAVQALAEPPSTVDDAVSATGIVRDVLASLPNLGGEIRPSGQDVHLEGDAVLALRMVPVRYRDVPGPRYAGQQSSGMPLREAILRMTPDDNGAAAAEFTSRSLAAERGEPLPEPPPEPPSEPLPHDHGPDLDGHHHAVHGALHPHGRDEFVYPEWDHVAGAYLPDWCLVRARRPRPIRSERAHRRALARHGRLLPGLVAQLERIRPAGRDLVLRQPDGDDIDLDACIEALTDLRAGVPPSERVYASLIERRRDVVVAFALDLSASTAERLPDGSSRILDLQRDAVSLLIEALERVGDAYGIYGFSGTGREDVRLSVVKDLDERRSPAMLHHLQGLLPQHTTRMGPAIRHLTERLAGQDAATKLMLIVSDGRPFDLDYGQQYGEDAVLPYAVADTARALTEARARGVRPYLITVDPAGGDYLRDMCDPREYHVIADARELPAALAQLYVVARADAASAPSYSGAFSK